MVADYVFPEQCIHLFSDTSIYASIQMPASLCFCDRWRVKRDRWASVSTSACLCVCRLCPSQSSKTLKLSCLLSPEHEKLSCLTAVWSHGMEKVPEGADSLLSWLIIMSYMSLTLTE